MMQIEIHSDGYWTASVHRHTALHFVADDDSELRTRCGHPIDHTWRVDVLSVSPTEALNSDDWYCHTCVTAFGSSEDGVRRDMTAEFSPSPLRSLIVFE